MNRFLLSSMVGIFVIFGITSCRTTTSGTSAAIANDFEQVLKPVKLSVVRAVDQRPIENTKVNLNGTITVTFPKGEVAAPIANDCYKYSAYTYTVTNGSVKLPHDPTCPSYLINFDSPSYSASGSVRVTNIANNVAAPVPATNYALHCDIDLFGKAAAPVLNTKLQIECHTCESDFCN